MEESPGFSFLAAMGREPPKVVCANVKKYVKKEEAEPEPVSNRDETKEKIERIKNALEKGYLTDEDLNDPLFAIDYEDCQSMTGGFRQHHVDHIKKTWRKRREQFVTDYKKLRQAATKELNKSKITKKKEQKKSY